MKTGITKHKERGTFFDASRGFTLLELMIAVGLFSLVIAGSFGVYIMCQRFWQTTTLNMQTYQMASMALSRIINGDGTNSGLREASSVAYYSYPSTVANSAYMHSHLIPATYTYWNISTTSPPTANNSYLNFYCSFHPYSDGGSWRLMFSNQFSGAKYIEYNVPLRTLSFGTNTQQRVILATYVNNAVVTTNDQGVDIAISVARRVGNLVSTSSVSAYVKFRN